MIEDCDSRTFYFHYIDPIPNTQYPIPNTAEFLEEISMSLSVTRSRVKEKCGIAVTTYDTTIDNLIAEIVPVIQYAIREEHIADTGNSPLQATLNLGATEIVSAEFLDQLGREPGAFETVSLDGFELKPSAAPAFILRRRGLARLRPFGKRDIANAIGGVAASGIKNEEEEG
jgi:hypothetical protein